MALFSIDSIFLRVWSTAGDEEQKRMAKVLMKFFNRYHWTLVSLVLFNCSCMMTLPIVLDSLVEPITALILSITVVLFVGEVIPLAFFVRYAIMICTFFSPVIWGSMIISAPLSYPVSLLLDYILGTHEELLDRDELAALILPAAYPSPTSCDEEPIPAFDKDDPSMMLNSITAGETAGGGDPRGNALSSSARGGGGAPGSPHNSDSTGGSGKKDRKGRRGGNRRDSAEDAEDRNAFRLREAEIRMLQGAMQLTRDTVLDHMRTKTENIFMLSSQQPLDDDTIKAIINSGFSRIPVYFGDDHRHVIGALIVNSLVKLCFAKPDPPPLVSNYPLREVMRLSESATLYDAYLAFREGISNMAVVYNSIGVMVGLLTLTDVLTALYQADEQPEEKRVPTVHARRTDKMVDVMEGMKFLSQKKHISSFLVSAEAVEVARPQVTVESVRHGSPGSLERTLRSQQASPIPAHEYHNAFRSAVETSSEMKREDTRCTTPPYKSEDINTVLGVESLTDKA